MQRRDFLRSMLAGVAVVAMPVLAGAAIENAAAIPMMDPNQHIIDALKLYDQLLATAAIYNGRKAFSGIDDLELNDKMHDAFDRLIKHIFATFKYEKSEEVFDVTRAMLRGENLVDEATIRKVPPVVVESAWPIILVTIILRDRKLLINTRKLTTFKRFHEQYGDFFLSNSWSEVLQRETSRKANAA